MHETVAIKPLSALKPAGASLPRGPVSMDVQSHRSTSLIQAPRGLSTSTHSRNLSSHYPMRDLKNDLRLIAKVGERRLIERQNLIRQSRDEKALGDELAKENKEYEKEVDQRQAAKRVADKLAGQESAVAHQQKRTEQQTFQNRNVARLDGRAV